LVAVFSHLYERGDDVCGTANTTSTAEETSGHDVQEQCESLYLLAAALVGAQRMSQAAMLLRRLETMTATSSSRQMWRARAEFLRAVHAEHRADIPGVLVHCAGAELLIGGTTTDQADSHSSRGRRRLLRTVDEVASEQVSLLTARAHIGLGESQEAEIILEGRYGNLDTAAGRHPATVAMLACRQGRLSDALRLASTALRSAGRHHVGAEPVELEARLVLAEVSYERNELDAAQEHLEAALRWCFSSGATPWMWVVRTYLARLLVAQSRTTEALSSLEELRQVKESGLLPALVSRNLNQVAIDCRLQLGDLEEAVGIVENNSPQDFDRGTLARVELCSGRPDRAIGLLSTRRALGLSGQIRRLVLLACAEKQLGRPERASDTVRRAVKAAEPEGYIRPFFEHPTQVHPLLRDVAGSFTGSYLSRLINQTDPTGSDVPPYEPTAVLEPLSKREWQVLQYLPSHRNVRQIANLMFISTNTVKTHLKNIYRKTGATSRDEAVTIARSHGLICGSPS
jgi:DNA-binding CsgD family transcriptional regulator